MVRMLRTTEDKGETPSGNFSAEIVHAFGSLCGSKLRDTAILLDEGAEFLLHPVGRQVAIRNLTDGSLNFAVESPTIQEVTAFAVSRDRTLLVVCGMCRVPGQEAMRSQATVYELSINARNEPLQTLEELGTVGRLHAACFSSAIGGPAEEGNSLLCLAAEGLAEEPAGLDHLARMVVVLNWRRNTLVCKCSVDQQVDRILLSPLDSCVLSTSGPSSKLELRLLQRDTSQLQEGEEPTPDLPWQLVQLAQVMDSTGVPVSAITDHAWLEPSNGTLIACRSNGTICVLSSGTQASKLSASLPEPYLLMTLDLPFGPGTSSTIPMCVRCQKGSFLLGGTNNSVARWKHATVHQAPEFRMVGCVRIVGVPASSIKALDLAGEIGEERLVVGLENSCIGHLRFSAQKAEDGGEVACTLVGGEQHSCPVNLLDMAVQRPLLLSGSSVEKSIRLWDYQAGSCELSHTFTSEEDLTGLAIHPMGFLMAVAFADRIRFYHILAKELKLHREVAVKNVKSIRFSNGGHLLAASQGTPGKIVIVINVKTMSKLATLRGHNHQVTAMSFDPDDQVLVTCGEDGSVYEWSMTTWSKVHDSPAKGEVKGTSAVAGQGSASWACLAEGSQSFLRRYKKGVTVENQDYQLPLPHLNLLSLVYHCGSLGVTLLGAGSDGGLYSFIGMFSGARSAEKGLHSGACNALCLSSDGTVVATAGEDGAIFILNVNGFADPTTAFGDEPSLEVVLVNRNEMQARQEELVALAAEASSLQQQQEEGAARLQSQLRARVDEARRKDGEKIQSLRNRYESLQQAATAQEREALRLLKSMEAAHVVTADEMDKAFDKKAEQEAERYKALQEELKTLNRRFDHAVETSLQTLESKRAERLRELEYRTAEKDKEVQRLKELLALSQQRYDAMLDQEGMEHDFEVNELQREGHEELDHRRQIERKLKKEQDTLLRGLDMMEKDRESISREQEQTGIIINNLKTEVENLQKEVDALKAERKEREAVLKEKEVEIGTHKAKVNTLKKFKHVLDFRLREVTLSLQPKDHMIQQLNAQLHDLEMEFERQLEVQKQMEVQLKQKGQQSASLVTELSKLKELIKQHDRTIFRFVTDLDALLSEEQDIRQWPAGIRKVYKDHADLTLLTGDNEGTAPMKELGRQIEVLDKKAKLLSEYGASTEANCKAEIMAKTQENSLLIQELTELRAEIKQREKQAKELELRVLQEQQKLSYQATLSAITAGQSSSRGSSARRSATDARGPIAPDPTELFSERVQALRGPQGSLKKVGSAHKSKEERKAAQRALAKADLEAQRQQMQRLRERVLADLPDETQRPHRSLMSSESSRSLPTTPAGGALAAVRTTRFSHLSSET